MTIAKQPSVRTVLRRLSLIVAALALLLCILQVLAFMGLSPFSTPDIMESKWPNGKARFRIGIRKTWPTLTGSYDTWFDGEYCEWRETGTLIVRGAFSNRRRDGLWRVFSEDGSPEVEARFDEGVLIGSIRTRLSNGSMMETQQSPDVFFISEPVPAPRSH